MAVIQSKPTSAGRRFVVRVRTEDLHKGEPHGPLLAKKTRTGGRNNKGRITTRHRGGGHKQRYRIIDFKRAKDGIRARVERIEYDPNRSAHIALLLYADGERRYIVAPRGVAVGDELMSGAQRTDSIRQLPLPERHSGRQHGSLRGVQAGEGSSDRA